MSRLTTQLTIKVAGLRGPGLAPADLAVIEEAKTDTALNAEVAEAAAASLAASKKYVDTIPELTAAVSQVIGPNPVQPGTNAGFSAPTTITVGDPMPYDGTIGTLSYDIRSINGGGVVANVCSGALPGSLTVERSVALPAPTAIGVQTVDGSILGTVLKDQRITLATPAGGAMFGDQQGPITGATRYFRNAFHNSGTAAYTAGTANTSHRANYTAVRLKVKVPRTNINDTDAANLALLEGSAAVLPSLPGLPKVAAKPVTIFETNFGAAQPADWTIAGGWTFSAAGMLSPVGDGSFNLLAASTQAQNKICSSEERLDRFIFRPATTGLNMWIGIGRNSGIRRTVVHVDSVNGRFAFATYNSITFPRGTGFPTESAITSAMSALTADRDYALEMSRNKRVITARLIDLKTNTVLASISNGSNTLVLAEGQENVAGEMFGAPGVQIVAGQVLIKSVTQQGRIKSPRVMMIGDSRTHMSTFAISEPQRWAAQVREALGGSAVIAAHDGFTGAEMIPYLIKEIVATKPDWLVEGFGTNDSDTNLAAYTAQLDALIAACNDNGIRMATIIVPPATGRVFTNLNAYKLALPNSIRKIRFDLALSANNDGVTTDNTKTNNNPLHPGATGQNLMFAQLKVDLPEIFL